MRYRLLLQTSRALQDPPSSAPPAVDSRCVSHGSPAGPPALGPTLPSLLQRSQAKGPRPWPGALLLPTGPQRAPRAPSPPHHSSQRPSLTLPTPLSSDRCHFTSLCLCLSVSPTRTKPSVGFVLFLLQPQCPEWGQACRRGGGGHLVPAGLRLRCHHCSCVFTAWRLLETRILFLSVLGA